MKRRMLRDLTICFAVLMMLVVAGPTVRDTQAADVPVPMYKEAQQLTGESVRDRLLDLLGEAEDLVEIVPELDHGYLVAIHSARAAVVDIPVADLGPFTEYAGPSIVQLNEQMVRTKVAVRDLLRYRADGTIPEYLRRPGRLQEAAQLASGGFPTMIDFDDGGCDPGAQDFCPGDAPYPNNDPNPLAKTQDNGYGDDAESSEETEEDREDAECSESEEEDECEGESTGWCEQGGNSCDYNGDLCSGDCPGESTSSQMAGTGSLDPGLCDKRYSASDPKKRATRLDVSVFLGNIVLMNVDRTLHAVADRFCSQEIAGFSCALCCIPVDIVLGIAEGIHEVMLECEGLADGAEIEATYHNVRTVYDAVAHLHTDLEAHNGSLTSQVRELSESVDHLRSIVHAELGQAGAQAGAQPSLGYSVIDVDVVRINPQTSPERFLVSTTAAGQPVDVSFSAILASRATPVQFDDWSALATVTALETGVYELIVDDPEGRDLYKLVVSREQGSPSEQFGQVTFRGE